jgi:tRNA threonylcarbamoyladenosine biosynthesis protein TsaE
MKSRYTEKEINEIAQKVISEAESKVLCLYGDMGAGKTTLVKTLVKELGGNEEVSSPTFGIVNEYHSIKGALLGYHFDFYRLNDEMEALDLGFEDYLNQDAWIFIEWPEKIPSFLPEDAMNIHINILDPTTREISIEHAELDHKK